MNIQQVNSFQASPHAKSVEQQPKVAHDISENTTKNVEAKSSSEHVSNVSKSNEASDFGHAAKEEFSRLDVADKMVAIEAKKVAKSEATEAEVTTEATVAVEEDTELTEEGLAEKIEDLNEMSDSRDSRLNFSVDDDSGKRVFKIIDKETGDVLNQYPTEPLLKLAAVLSDMTEKMQAGNDRMVDFAV